MRKTKEEEGITLIALVITIIILLILAGISISALTNQGLFTKTILAVEKNKKADYKEKVNFIIQETQISKIGENDEGLFIDNLAYKINETNWKDLVTITNNEFNEPQNDGEKNIIIVNTVDGYEITIRVDNIKIEAEIVSIIKGKAKIYTITYFANNGSEDKKEISLREGFSTVVPENTFENNGYEFVGWGTSKDALEAEYVEGNTIESVNENIKLYAIWSKSIATITFIGNGKKDTQIVNKGTQTPLKSFSSTGITKTGYLFIGWSETEENGQLYYQDEENIQVSEDINLYAIWEQDSVTVSLAIKNGNNDTDILTDGTVFTIDAQSTKTDITNLKLEMINVNNQKTVVKVYENLDAEKNKYLTLSGLEKSLMNLNKLEFWSKYICRITATTKVGATASKEIEIRDSTIGSANDLNILAMYVNDLGTTFSDTTITLVSDIKTTENYIPIGYYDGVGTFTGPYFAGTFEGKNHSIQISSITSDTKYQSSGIFGMVIGGNIYNLTASGTNFGAKGVTGGVTGCIKNGKILGCTFQGSITDDQAKNNKGGISGYVDNSEINNCYNLGAVEGKSNVGGIVGYAINKTQINNCKNSGTIEAFGTSALTWIEKGSSVTYSYAVLGGIAGKTDDTTIDKCENSGSIYVRSVEEGSLEGGIVGCALNNTKIKNSKNTGYIKYFIGDKISTNGGGLGGICGFLYMSEIEQSFNQGVVSSAFISDFRCMNNVGGILGYGNTVTVKNCYNICDGIEGRGNVGGILGCLSCSNSSLNNNYMYNLYNAMTNISGSSTFGNWAGYTQNVTGDRNSWVSDTNIPNVGSAKAGSTWGERSGYTLQEMSTTDNLLNLLNAGNGEGLWARDINGKINNGYPYLINNQP